MWDRNKPPRVRPRSPLSANSGYLLRSCPLRCYSQQQPQKQIDDEEEEEDLIGDSVVFEDDAFEDWIEPYPAKHSNEVLPGRNPRRLARPMPQNLIPEEWQETVEALHVTQEKRHEFAHEIKTDVRVNRRKGEVVPLSNVSVDDYMQIRKKILAKFKPVVLENPTFREDRNEGAPDKPPLAPYDGSSSNGRVTPRDPRHAVYGGTFDDISKVFNSEAYLNSRASSVAKEPGQTFSREEIREINKRKPDLLAVTSAKWLPLHSLVAAGEFYFMDHVLKNDVNINAVDKCGWTALHRAVMGRQLATLNYLLGESANPHLLDNEGASLLHYAVISGSLQIIQILLLYDLDINLQDCYGWTPLHLAIHARNVDVLRLLLTKGADRSLRNKDGLTPLELCLYSGRDLQTYYLIWLLKVFPGSCIIRGSSRERIVN